ncbi:MAG TPA: Crp/Fnr family transcriptional regulator [Candidatus Gemmiger avistercoris]|uniref:Crp/Fnr family transcriptional regulator n=1 Tax=Candidatus Gemmiger avistercoris TaxID=2838606 RepID=A0A9D2JQB4_9FIRM|nr:Crp/Fnr family transcriptional regulator [uncultured Subdoligranulum sp.]HIZ62858.1 Crp/Fnr family transcriptional regulator [Candidatus Gemmiger avistercoris]
MEIRDLPHVPLFRGLAEEETALALAALNARRLPFRRGRQLLQAGQCTGRFGLVLAGRVHIEHLDVWGSKTLLGQAQEGDLFAETYACLPHEPMLVQVTAASDGEALFLDGALLLAPGSEPWRQQLTRNLLEIAARKNLELARRNLYTAPKTIRGRVTAYFSALAVKSGSLRFTLPYDRQQLADYLGVDRSALSSTLSQMQRDGLLVLGRRTVELRTPPETL